MTIGVRDDLELKFFAGGRGGISLSGGGVLNPARRDGGMFSEKETFCPGCGRAMSKEGGWEVVCFVDSVGGFESIDQ